VTIEHDPDLQTLNQVADGDIEAFSALVERHQRRLHALCERMLGDREEARDAVQEVFIKVFKKAGSFRPKGQVFTWIYRIAVNHCLNKLRRRKIVQFFSLGADAEDDRPVFEPRDEAAGPEESLQARERWAVTRRALDSLPASQRPVVVLAKFEGLSYRKIAEVMGISEGAVESRLVRAMRHLRSAQEKAFSGVPRTRESQG
jgi:RNA polymerase sigma-70 factor (ECF subfamily)